MRQGKIVRVTGHESSDEDGFEDQIDEETLLRCAQTLVKRKEYKEARNIYGNILSKKGICDGHRAIYSDPNLTARDKLTIIRSSLGMAKCHLRMSEYSETVSSISKCIGLMKESSHYNKVHAYQLLGAAYLMLMEYRASLLVCLYGLTQFNEDEKLLTIQNYILSR